LLTLPATIKLKIDIPRSFVTSYLGIRPPVSYALSGELKTKAQAAFFDLNVSSMALNLSSNNRTQVNGQAILGTEIAYG